MACVPPVPGPGPRPRSARRARVWRDYPWPWRSRPSPGGRPRDQAGPMNDSDPITDFTRRSVTVEGVAKTVYVAGTGPAVVVLPEMPGISPDVLRLARWVRDAGFTVHVPSLFGTDGAFPTVEGGREVVRRACVSAEFRAFAGGGTSPVTVWLRGLARQAHTACGGPGVGAIGLCFTGNFALTMALEGHQARRGDWQARRERGNAAAGTAPVRQSTQRACRAGEVGQRHLGRPGRDVVGHRHRLRL
ncbi:dienelactone hydrolase family protein [Streptomyces filipinensis]|uniref:dienelactone hydrolase family protein n=1 Tax=Streptomyces filipinensis TaxID=66887 RepID=UPI0027E5357B|nr:dienelactone hydrolase family protein [Streptomyces filipinensis]